MEWTGCDLVEVVPGKVSGQPVVKDTRILADSIVEAYELGMSPEEIADDFPTINRAFPEVLQADIVRRLLAYAHQHLPR
jgi:uncharacterized protein (DUF433 family)